jgi:hypothetical protein
MYKYLLAIQNAPTWKILWGVLPIPNKNWGLPPLSNTVFSEKSMMSAPPIKVGGTLVSHDGQDRFQGAELILDDERIKKTTAARMEEAGNEILRTTYQPYPVESLTPVQKRQSIDLARTILDNLKVIAGKSTTVTEWQKLPHYDMVESLELVTGAGQMFKLLHDMARTKGNPENDPTMLNAFGSLRCLSYTALVESAKEYIEEGNMDRVRKVQGLIERLPKECRITPDTSMQVMLSDLVQGLEHSITLAEQGLAMEQQQGVQQAQTPQSQPNQNLRDRGHEMEEAAQAVTTAMEGQGQSAAPAAAASTPPSQGNYPQLNGMAGLDYALREFNTTGSISDETLKLLDKAGHDHAQQNEHGEVPTLPGEGEMEITADGVKRAKGQAAIAMNTVFTMHEMEVAERMREAAAAKAARKGESGKEASIDANLARSVAAISRELGGVVSPIEDATGKKVIPSHQPEKTEQLAQAQSAAPRPAR